MFIKPVKGRTVPDIERGGLLLPEGRQVEATQYWLSRLRDGDVVQCLAAVQKTKGATKP
tara:strand:- start:77 stop:253 length:177 start_codon:yes stop_codon:yes gene_type:complete